MGNRRIVVLMKERKKVVDIQVDRIESLGTKERRPPLEGGGVDVQSPRSAD